MASAIDAYFMSEIAEALWNAYVDLGERLAENKNNKDKAIKRYALVKLENNIPVAVKTFEAEASFCFPSISPGYKR